MENGTYAAHPKAASVYESDGGALVLSLVHEFQGGGEIKSYHALTTKDGAVNTRTIDGLKKWSGWDGVDPYWFMDVDLTGISVELVIENEPGFRDPSKMYPKVQWVNAAGGGVENGLHEASDRRAVLAKYGAKFRAVAGGTPVAPRPAAVPAPRPAPAPAARPPAARPPAAAPAPRRPAATQATAWARLNELGAGMAQGELENLWFACVDSTGMDQAEMTPEGWVKVTEAVEAHFAGNSTVGNRQSAVGSGEGTDSEEPTPF